MSILHRMIRWRSFWIVDFELFRSVLGAILRADDRRSGAGCEHALGFSRNLDRQRCFGAFVRALGPGDQGCRLFADDGARLREGLIDRTNTASSVWADTAYRSKANEDFLADVGKTSQIHRRKPEGKPMPKRTARANSKRSKVRARVEPVFAHQKDRMNRAVRSIGRQGDDHHGQASGRQAAKNGQCPAISPKISASNRSRTPQSKGKRWAPGFPPLISLSAPGDILSKILQRFRVGRVVDNQGCIILTHHRHRGDAVDLGPVF